MRSALVFFLNTLIIVVAQVWVLKRIEGRSRTASCSPVAALIWGSSWRRRRALRRDLAPLAAGVVIALGFGVFASAR